MSLPALGDGQRRRRRGQGHRLGQRLRQARRHHLRPVPGPGRHPAGVRRRGPGHQPPERGVPGPAGGPAGRPCTSAWLAIGMAEPGAELARDVVACPGADTCNLAVTQSRGSGRRHRARRSRRPAWPTSAVCASTSRAAPTAAASTTSPTSGSSAPSAGPMASPPPATRCCSAATSAIPRSSSGRRRCACRPRRPPRPPSGSSAASPTSAKPAKASPSWLERVGGAEAVGAELKELDVWPTPEERPDYYVDFDETGPYVAEVGEGECAAT